MQNGGLKKNLCEHLPYSVCLGFGQEDYYLMGGGIDCSNTNILDMKK